ncbi:MAG: GNAT family N-acetyltransferase [Bdellovibrionaceae bacterium]|nr:GNAT family N-acetyltransferase [Pseudobdellovibrionaceae bacterium]
MRVRPLSPSDAHALQRILANSGSTPGVPVWSESEIAEILASHRGWGLEDDFGLGAFILVQNLPIAWEILHLATDPRVRRKGYMAELLAAVIAARESGKEVWLEVHEANQPARQLYEKMGFRNVGRRSAYYADGGAAVLYNLG